MANVHTFSESHYVRLLIAPSASNGDLNTAWVSPFADGGSSDRSVFMLTCGATTETVDVALYQASDSSGTGRKAITGAAITQITSSTDEVIKTIEIAPGALDDKNGFKFVRAEVTVGAAGTTPYSVTLINHRLRYPGDFDQHSSYNEAVLVYG